MLSALAAFGRPDVHYFTRKLSTCHANASNMLAEVQFVDPWGLSITIMSWISSASSKTNQVPKSLL